MFETKDIITIFLAVYGAILSSILAIREARKGKRSIQLFLDYYQFEMQYKLTIVNIGYRPITILGCGFRYFYRNGKPVDPKPIKLTKDEQSVFPLNLKDGENKIIAISQPFANPGQLKTKRQKIEAYVRDAEGNIFKTTTIRSYSTKMDSYG